MYIYIYVILLLLPIIYIDSPKWILLVFIVFVSHNFIELIDGFANQRLVQNKNQCTKRYALLPKFRGIFGELEIVANLSS